MFNSDAERRLRRQLPHGSTGPASGNPPTSTPFPTGQSIADGVAVYSFDGQGNFTDLNFAMRDGLPNVPAGTPGLTPDGFISQSGTYHINPDCTGAGTMSQPNLSTTFAIVVGDRGRTFRIVGTSLHVATIPGNPDNLGIRPQVLSDLLGHRDPESISAYVRIATETLRDVSLPVPT